MEKKIQITPNLFKLQKTKNTKKTRSKQNINKLLRKIKEHAAKKNPELKFNKETKLKDHINYLEELSKKNKKTRSNRTKEQVSIKLPNELNTVTNARMKPTIPAGSIMICIEGFPQVYPALIITSRSDTPVLLTVPDKVILLSTEDERCFLNVDA